jgi:hypothetical protein
MPAPTAAAGSVQVGRYLYVVGGFDDRAPLANVRATQRFDLVTRRWTRGPQFAAARADFALAATDTALYAIGGDEPGGGYFDPSEATARLPLGVWPDGHWAPFVELPRPARHHANSGGFCTSAFFGAEVWTVGGRDQFGIPGESLFSPVAPERCSTIRADVPWLSVGLVGRRVPADSSRRLSVDVDARLLPPGTYDATILVTTSDPGALELRVPVHVIVTEPSPPTRYLSVRRPATLSGRAVRDEDVVGVNDDGFVTPYFDGSDVGLGSARIDAFAPHPDGSLLLSFAGAADVPGVGPVAGADVVRFVPTSLGSRTAGTFEPWLEGAAVGLDGPGEDVDALALLDDGRVLVSTTGTAVVPGATATGSDVLVLRPSTGTFRLYLDGSDVALDGTGENIDALAVGRRGELFVSTDGELRVPGRSATADDVVRFTWTALGDTTSGAFGRYLDGATIGLDGNDVTGFALD